MQRQANIVMDELFRQRCDLNINNQEGNDDEQYIPWLDCARSYGLSEKFVGDYLRTNDIRPEDVYVSSKWGYTYVADWKVELGEGEPHEIKDHSLEVSAGNVDDCFHYVDGVLVIGNHCIFWVDTHNEWCIKLLFMSIANYYNFQLNSIMST